MMTIIRTRSVRSLANLGRIFTNNTTGGSNIEFLILGSTIQNNIRTSPKVVRMHFIRVSIRGTNLLITTTTCGSIQTHRVTPICEAGDVRSLGFNTTFSVQINGTSAGEKILKTRGSVHMIITALVLAPVGRSWSLSGIWLTKLRNSSMTAGLLENVTSLIFTPEVSLPHIQVHFIPS
jgi:hypothetical protein